SGGTSSGMAVLAQDVGDAHYGMVRDTINLPDLHQLEAAGYNGLLFRADDPGLAQGIAEARAAGITYVGIWAPPHGDTPEQFAERLAGLSQYKPSIVVPDVEIEGKGDPPRPGE